MCIIFNNYLIKKEKQRYRILQMCIFIYDIVGEMFKLLSLSCETFPYPTNHSGRPYFCHAGTHTHTYTKHRLFNYSNFSTFFFNFYNLGFLFYQVILQALNFPYRSISSHCIEIAHSFLCLPR